MDNKKNKTKKVFSIIGNALIWLFVIFAIVVTILAFASLSSADGVPSLGGNVILTVQTPSMEPTFNVGDLIIGKKLTTEEQRALKVDDIITYDAGDLDGDGTRDLNSHRIIEVKTAKNGSVSYVTKGDHNLLEDAREVSAENVICKYNNVRLKGIGSVLNFLQTPTGFLIVIVIPLFLFFIFELIMFIRKFLQVKNADKKQITAEEEELIKQRAIEEYLRSQKAAADAEVKDQPESDPDSVKQSEDASEGASDGN